MTIISGHLWAKVRKDSKAVLQTPFMVALMAGNLPIGPFRNFVSQDIRILECMITVLQSVVQLVDKDLAKTSIKMLIEDLGVNASYLKQSGFGDTKSYPDNLITIRYRKFIMAVDSGDIEGIEPETPLVKLAAFILAAISPHMQLYPFICEDIRSRDHPYSVWVRYCANHCRRVSTYFTFWLDALSTTLSDNETTLMHQLYGQAMKFELDLFSSLSVDPKTILRKPKMSDHGILVLLNFDVTCTTDIAKEILLEAYELQCLNQNELRSKWRMISKRYADDYEECIKEMLLTDKADRFDYTALKKAFKKLCDTEKRTNTRIIESGVLKGIRSEDVKFAGASLVFPGGFMGFLKSMTTTENTAASMHIVSDCCCVDLIESAFSSVDVHGVDIHANALIFEQSISTRGFIRSVETAFDEVHIISDIRETTDQRKKLTIFIGQSLGDLLCLLEADIGIVMGSSDDSLQEVAKHFGVSVVPLVDALAQKERETAEGNTFCWVRRGVLYTTSSWDEVKALIIGS